MGNDGEEGSPGAEEEEQEGEPGRCHEGGIPSPQGWTHVKEFIIIHIYDVECDDYLRCLLVTRFLVERFLVERFPPSGLTLDILKGYSLSFS